MPRRGPSRLRTTKTPAALRLRAKSVHSAAWPPKRRRTHLIPFLSSGLYRRPRDLTGSAGTVESALASSVPARGLSPPVGIFTPPRNEQGNCSTDEGQLQIENGGLVCCSDNYFFFNSIIHRQVPSFNSRTRLNGRA